MTNINKITFADLGLNTNILNALKDLGYEQPSPIQIACIPLLLKGHDVLGTAQTGSGKTAAFSLPLLNNINQNLAVPQILVLAPTRELAIQVTAAFNSFAKYMPSIHVLAIYGGQRYDVQLKSLVKGPQIIVGTPGRLLDHLNRGTLNLDQLQVLVLDEADEMLRMGFIEDVETIMSKIPVKHQTILFSATMPEPIRRITRRFMKQPKDIRIQSNITTRPNINQSYWTVYGYKGEALLRFLEVEDFDAAIIFVRTRNMTLELAEILDYNGYKSAALNGDMNQFLREQTLQRLKDGRLDILIATDVAARGLDVERISLVINYNIPLDVESYIHRIGRTGRAGRSGRALLFVEKKEHRLFKNIERVMRSTIPEIKLPNSDMISKRRQQKFAKLIQNQIISKDLEQYRFLLKKFSVEEKLDIEILATILLKMAQGNRPLILPPKIALSPLKNRRLFQEKYSKNNRAIINNASRIRRPFTEMELYRIEVGRDDGIEVRHIVGTIANEFGINSSNIGNIKLFSSHAIIELSKNISKEIFQNCNRARILNKPIHLKLLKNTNTHKIQESRENKFQTSLSSNNTTSSKQHSMMHTLP